LMIDGGKGQVTSAQEALQEYGVTIPIIGLAKRYEEIIIPTNNGFETIILASNSPALLLIRRIRDEAHRFVIGYHRKLRDKSNQI
jgi:excinuclease ABC subunit C